MRIVLTVLVVLTSLLTSCGPTCQSTCSRLYAEDQCYIQRAGHRDQTELRQRCLNECDDALKTPGPVGGYDPYESAGSSINIELENETQAALWMDCISEQDCERLEKGGFCAPVW